MARHRLLINRDVLVDDIQTVQKYPIDQRTVYTLINQLTRITTDRGALIHDDRLDSMAGAVRPWIERIALNEDDRIAQKQTNENVRLMNEWAEVGSPEQRVALAAQPKTGMIGIARSKALGGRRRRRR